MISDFHELLACPIHRVSLAQSERSLGCKLGCSFPIIGGVPFLLPRNIQHTHSGLAEGSFALADEMLSAPQQSNDEQPAEKVDQTVQELVAHTNSNLYRPLIGRLESYPIPDFPFEPPHAGALLLDIGSGWGRWCIAAARRGFRPIGLDLSLMAALAATRVARQLGVKAMFVVGDSRYIPFQDATFDAAYSYSVLQHFSKDDVRATLRSLAPILRPGATTKLHLLNRYGLRSLQVQVARGFREPREFETRYWSPHEMLSEFAAEIGPSSMQIDGFFVQGRYEDRRLFKLRHRLLVEASHLLTLGAAYLPFLKYAADNIFVVSRKPAS
jgi:SAM-dependent methyltransferase/uncharacterized protein YbaR (Trm112 family)